MAHPVIDEITRCYSLQSVQSHAFRRWQRVLRDEVQPLLDERETFIEENNRLREEVQRLEREVQQVAVTPKRGRPRKAQDEAVV